MTNLSTTIARVYAARVLARLNPQQLFDIAMGRAHPDDYCDANMVLADAFMAVCGRETWLSTDVEDGTCTEAQADADLAVWNDAAGEAAAARWWLSTETSAEPVLCDILAAWSALHGLEPHSADEMRFYTDDEAQRGWLQQFVELWYSEIA